MDRTTIKIQQERLNKNGGCDWSSIWSYLISRLVTYPSVYIRLRHLVDLAIPNPSSSNLLLSHLRIYKYYWTLVIINELISINELVIISLMSESSWLSILINYILIYENENSKVRVLLQIPRPVYFNQIANETNP